MDTVVERLAREVQRGREGAFEDLVHHARDRIYRLAYRVTGNADDALDVTQEALVRVYKEIGSWDRRSAFTSWLYRVVVNLAIDHRRRRPRAVQLADGAEAIIPDRGVPHAEAFADAEEKAVLLDRVRRAFACLSPGQRAVVVLRHHEGMSLKEIAEVRGCALGTVKSTLFQAFQALREAVGEKGPADAK